MEFKILNSNQLKVYLVLKKFEKLVFTTKKIRDSESIVIFDPPNLFENNSIWKSTSILNILKLLFLQYSIT